MTRTNIATVLTVLAASVASAPASAWAQATASPDTTTGPSSSPPTQPGSGAPTAVSSVPAQVVVSGAITLQTQATALLGRILNLTGRVASRYQGLPVVIQRLDPVRGWVAATRARVNRHGGFVARWRTNLAGRLSVRAVMVPAAAATRRRSHGPSGPLSSPPAQITVYHSALASWFGPGFYGSTTACGQRMTPELIGVAHRTLPCGTLVEISYGDERLTVPVVDRGPYANGADWDLTQGAATALGLTETVRIGAIVVGRVASTPQLGAPPGSDSSGAPGSAGSPGSQSSSASGGASAPSG